MVLLTFMNVMLFIFFVANIVCVFFNIKKKNPRTAAFNAFVAGIILATLLLY